MHEQITILVYATLTYKNDFETVILVVYLKLPSI